MADKTVDQKIKECKELIIQNMEKTIQHKMVYMYLKDRKKDTLIKQFSVNSKDGIIKIEFNDHDKAEAFYDQCNFNDCILLRPFNIYFNLALTEDEMKKYYLEGISEENQRNLFEAARKIGVCKLYTSYGSGARAKLKATGLLSFIRKDPISEAEFKKLSEDLKTIGVKINTYVQDKGLKVSLNLVNFVSDEHYTTDDVVLHDLAESTARSIIEKHVGNSAIGHLSVIFKKKDNIQNRNTVPTTNKVLSSALFEFKDAETTFENYEKVRLGIKDDDSNVRVKLFFHNEESNSYLSLITQGLAKPAQLSEKQYEEELINSFRKVNKNVIQVNVYPVNYNNTYIGRVYLRSEEEGKNFLIDYSTHRNDIYMHYKEKNEPFTFNINIDTKTLRKIKLAEKKARETEDKIKKQSEANRRDNRRAPNQIPLNMNPIGLGPNPMMPLVGPPMMMPGMAPGMGGIVPPPLMKDSMMPPPLPPMMGRPQYGVPFGAKQFQGPPVPIGMAPQGQMNIKARIAQVIRDRQRIVDMEANNAKRVLSEPLKGAIQESGIAIGAQSTRLMNLIIKDKDANIILNFIQFPDQLRQAVQQAKNNQN